MDTIKVVVRVRPLNSRERAADQASSWTVAGNQIAPARSGQPYTFDRVFDEVTHTEQMYSELARSVITSAMEGVNGTIFAYGQTASGKTHTMQGSRDEPGIIRLAIRDIFDYVQTVRLRCWHQHELIPAVLTADRIEECTGPPQCRDREFLLRVSYMEIYNEAIRDLLQPANDNLKIHENSRREIFVGNLSEKIVMSSDDVAKLMAAGEEHRHVGSTNANERSSRSHTIFRMVIESRDRAVDGVPSSKQGAAGGAVRVASLNLVDLAGSERVRHTGSEGIRLKEGSHINKSLLTLATVIGKLAEGNDRGHVPFRDSKLTRILQPSLGGNARTMIICTMSPALAFMDESHSTLKFASRAKDIKNKPQVNEIVSDEALLRRYQNEITQLRQQLSEIAQNSSKTTEATVPATVHVQTNELLERLLQEKHQEETHLQSKIYRLAKLILNFGGTSSAGADNDADGRRAKRQQTKRRQTWYPGMRTAVSLLDEAGDHDTAPAAAARPRWDETAISRTHTPTSSKREAAAEFSEDEDDPDLASRGSSPGNDVRRASASGTAWAHRWTEPDATSSATALRDRAAALESDLALTRKRLYELDPTAEADHTERQWAIVRAVLAEPRNNDRDDQDDGSDEDEEAADDDEDHGSTTLDEPWKEVHRHIVQLRDHSDRQAGMLAAQAREHAAQLQFAEAELQAERIAAAAALATERACWYAKEAELRRAAEESAMLASSLRENVTALAVSAEASALSLAQARASVERTTGDLDNARAAISALQADVTDVATERDRARAELAATVARSEANAAELEHVRSELAQAVMELGSVRTQLDAAVASAEAQASEQAALLRTAATEHARMEADLALVRADLATAMARAASETASADATIAVLRGDLETVRTHLQTVQAAHDAAVLDRDAAVLDRDAAATERDRVQEAATAALAEAAATFKCTLERIEEEHQVTAAAAAAASAAQHEQLGLVEARLKEAEAAGVALLERVQQSEAEKDVLQATVADLTAAQERLNAAMQAQARDADDERAAHAAALSDAHLQSERDEHVRAHDELVDKAAALYDMHCTATARLAKVEAEAAVLEQSWTQRWTDSERNHAQVVHDLTTQTLELRQAADALKVALAAAEGTAVQERLAAATQRETLNAELVRLQAECMAGGAQETMLQAKVTELEAALRTAEARTDRLEAAVRVADDKVAAQFARFPWLAGFDETAGVAALRSVPPFEEALEAERVAYRRDQQMLKLYITQLEQKLADLKRDCQASRDDVARLEGHLSQCEGENAELTKKLRRLELQQQHPGSGPGGAASTAPIAAPSRTLPGADTKVVSAAAVATTASSSAMLPEASANDRTLRGALATLAPPTSLPTLAGALEEEIARLRGDVEALQRELRTVQLVKNNEMMKARQAQADLQRVQREKDALASENERLKPTATAAETSAVRPVPAALVVEARPASGGLLENENTGPILGRPAAMGGLPEKENTGPNLGRPAVSLSKQPVASAYPPRTSTTSTTALPAATVRRPTAASAATAQTAEGSPECSQQ